MPVVLIIDVDGVDAENSTGGVVVESTTTPGPQGPEGPPGSGGGGESDHGELDGLSDDDHPQYHNDARGDARYWPLSTDLATQVELAAEITARSDADTALDGRLDTLEAISFATDAELAAAISGLSAVYATIAGLAAHEADTTNVHGIANTALLETTSGAQSKADAAQAAAAAELDAHEAASNPHPGYLTPAEGNAAYQPLNGDLTALAAAGNSGVLAATTASFLTADETKLDGIEAGAEVNDTASEILTKLLTVDGSGSGLDADLLDGQSSAAFETPAGAQAKADAKVAQTISNGVTTSAPSQDVVFDALANKQDVNSDLTDLVAQWAAASGSGPASLGFPEDTDNGSNKVTLIAPAAVTSDRTLTLPDASGTVPVLINTDGDAGVTIYVGSIDPDVNFTPVDGDVWIEVP